MSHLLLGLQHIFTRVKLRLICGRKTARFDDALRLLKVSSLMHDYDPVGVHQAVGDWSGCRRGNYDALEVKVLSRLHFFHHLGLLSDKVVNYRTTYVTLSGFKSFRGFDLARL